MTMGDKIKPVQQQDSIAAPAPAEVDDSREHEAGSADDQTADRGGPRLIEEEALIDAPGS